MNQDLIQRIKDANNIESVISEHLNISKSGVNYKAVCPFHQDGSPSLSISPAKQIYKCFACGASGDVFTFLQELNNWSFYETLKHLADRSKIEMPEKIEETADAKARRLEKDKLIISLRNAQATYINGRVNQKFYDFLGKRKISQAIADEFGLGYANDSFFVDRITYPFYDNAGNVIGFTGRACTWSKDSKYPKFKNSADSPLYNKSRVLFGLKQSQRAIQQANKCIIVEGQHDVLTLHQAGVRNVVCASGTAFTADHAKILSRYTQNFVLLFDGDTAGRNATDKTLATLLAANLSVAICSLPDKEDPDSFFSKNPNAEEFITKNSRTWSKYLLSKFPYIDNEIDTNAQHIETLTSYVNLIPEQNKRTSFTKSICNTFKISAKDIKGKIKPAPDTNRWANGFYGLEEAIEIKEEHENIELTFDKDRFLKLFGENPIVLWMGSTTKSTIQLFRASVSEFVFYGIQLFEDIDLLRNLLSLHKEKIKIFSPIKGVYEDESIYEFDIITNNVCNSYSYIYSSLNSETQSQYIDICLQFIAYTDETLCSIKEKDWISCLHISSSQYNKLLKPLIAKVKDEKSSIYNRIEFEENMISFDLERIPEYVEKNEQMHKTYVSDQYYPLLKKDGTKCGYIFKNEKGSGHSLVSDFWIEPLLHIYSTEKDNNKRVVKLNHKSEPSRYVEWKSSILTSLTNLEDQLINEGKYNFKGTAAQYKTLRQQLLYGFVTCEDIGTYGWHRDGFWAFSNAIYHEVKLPDGSTQKQISHTDNLGVVSHGTTNYYSPACSEIFLKSSKSQHEQDRHYIYKAPTSNDSLDFNSWASLMNEVYIVNDNGKWAVLFAVMACFRDFIFDVRRMFTSLFFIGPTGSGKSQLAYSVRSLFVSPDAPAFNLNSGTLPALSMIIERYRNIVYVLEEYNDNEIDDRIFQFLKSAVLDGEGRMKVGNTLAKEIDASKVNAVPVLLGQEAPQKDDSSLSNRCILCNVPNKKRGDYTEHEIEIFERLKLHEKQGLSNILLQVLNIRPIIKEHFSAEFTREHKLLKDEVMKLSTATDSVTRIINTVAMVQTISKIITEHTHLSLPFSHEEFKRIALKKVLEQVQVISTVNKLGNFFNMLSFLATHGEIKKDRDYKITLSDSVTIKTSSGDKETISFDTEKKILFLRLEDIYPKYVRQQGKDSISKQSLLNYFLSDPNYIGKAASAKFSYLVDSLEQDPDTGAIRNTYVRKSAVTTAYMFDYNMIANHFEIDLEMLTEKEPTTNILGDEQTDLGF